MNTQSMTPFVTILNGQVKTTSLKVAEYFGKRHDHVLRAIRDLECSSEFRLPNFGESSYINEQGKEQPCYEMTKNGFVFLVMGFTGPEAAKIKESYILAFDRMEAELLKLTQPANARVHSFAYRDNPFNRISSGKLRNLNAISTKIGEAYLISEGVAPEHVDDVIKNRRQFIGSAVPQIERPVALPLDALVSRFVKDWFEGILGVPFAPCLGEQMQRLFYRYRNQNDMYFPYSMGDFMAELYEHPSLYRQRVCVDKETDEHRVMVMINSLKPSKGKDFHVWVVECIQKMDACLSMLD